MEITHRFIETNGVRLHVAEAGPESGSPVLLLHGFPEFWYGWHAQIQALAEAGYRVIAPDQRGYNRSGKPRGKQAYSGGTLAADVAGLMDELGLESAYVAGHDWGGIVAWRLAAAHPQRVRKLAILNCAHPRVFARALSRSWVQRRKIWYFLLFQLPWLPELLLGMGNHRGAAALMKSSSRPGTFSEFELNSYRAAWGQPGAWRAMLNWYRASLLRSKEGRIDWRIRVPALIIWGRQDRVFMEELAEESLAQCDEGRLEMIPKAGHWVQHEEPEQVNRLLVEFFRD